MAVYNLYSAGEGLLNSKPLTTEEVVSVMNKQYVHKKYRNGKLVQIPTKKIRVVPTILY